MNEEKIIFNDKNINKSNFYKNKKLFKIDDIDVNKILVSKRESYGSKGAFKDFIGHNDNDDIRPLCIKLPQMNTFIRYFDDGNKEMCFKVSDKKLLKKYTELLDKD